MSDLSDEHHDDEMGEEGNYEEKANEEIVIEGDSSDEEVIEHKEERKKPQPKIHVEQVSLHRSINKFAISFPVSAMFACELGGF